MNHRILLFAWLPCFTPAADAQGQSFEKVVIAYPSRSVAPVDLYSLQREIKQGLGIR